MSSFLRIVTLLALVSLAACQEKPGPDSPEPQKTTATSPAAIQPGQAKDPTDKAKTAEPQAQTRKTPAGETEPEQDKPVPEKAQQPEPKPGETTPTDVKTPQQPEVQAKTYERSEFNSLAVRANLPLFWVHDRNANKTPDPDEVATLLFYGTAPEWTRDGKFTPAWTDALAEIEKARQLPTDVKSTDETTKTRALLVKELDAGRPIILASDLTGLGAEEKTFVGHMLRAGELIDSLFMVQKGTAGMANLVPADCSVCQSVFRRNFGPKCEGPETEKEVACNAIPGHPEVYVDPYPAEHQKKQGFCDELAKEPNAEALMGPFVVARSIDGKLEAVPLPQAYPELMTKVSSELNAAANAIRSTGETALADYLTAAAKAFQDNNWEPADEAWAKMNATNSKWYVRIAPDEVYWEPCSRKAGFHMTFARINPDSVEWQKKLQPVQQDMEVSLATLIGQPYQPRTVTFHLPDFIDIVTNNGDDREAFGATIGQSLPNWGPVANEGRGRTVVMSNLYTDEDSKAQSKAKAESLLVPASLTDFPAGQGPSLLGIILHEAAHNLGPSHEYKVDGKTDDQVFGGPLASLAEELKAQTASLWYIDYLLQKGLITPEMARQSYVDSFLWALGHISRGMREPNGKPKPYSQLAAIQVGYLIEAGAITWNPEAMAANGKDKGAFELHLEKFPSAVNKLMEVVGKLKAQGDKAVLESLIGKYVDGPVVPMPIVTERLLRYPKASFVYSVRL